MSAPTISLPLGTIPADIRNAQDYAALAPHFMQPSHYAYISGGSGYGQSVAANVRAFEQWAIYPRLLRDVSHGHTRITLAGEQHAHPLFLAPVAFHKLAHADGEIDTARAADATGTCMIASTQSSVVLEETVAQKSWFQLYLLPRREDTLHLLRRAEAAGYRAIVLTVDAPIQVANRRALAAQFQMPADCINVNLRDYDTTPRFAGNGPGESRFFQGAMRAAPSWDDIRWVMSETSLPVWVKGVLHPDDAVALRDAGVAGIVVSNHGGRSLDGAPAGLDVLPAVRAAVGKDFPVMYDGGILSGSDAFKALALGADAVAIGRLQLYALSVAGALGVAHMLKLLREELEICMAMAGCATTADINSGALLRQARRSDA
ncbi:MULTISPECIES: alpha-hydroxy acid oxidase [unclassified Duganella]|uniref:alpha-hydroxy acid oxidase n=1 Tax=unclassified Duganella TaxID=2636909 RepID=UPI000884CB54|nr:MULTISPECIES: alpha-hydroxy acid oxidase [unclassified Duganella]SDH04854.1 FMN-dependent dehydrogenase, includes L-lactate dehydrogenase and type II isopentenyl diphosphate isomerase [Duganella sp. OV458]SDK21255.1 FMN-dependent dehydrogenase, includes L-lactate dehydrogenase and type II isopentenyl diphosphate isomerase [Duganella sp. OV510]